MKKAKPVSKPRSAEPAQDLSTSGLIDQRIAELNDWRGQTLARVRALIKQADDQIIEEWKWNVPVWSCDGIICTGETYKSAVKLTFAKGASLADPSKLFNSSLEGNTRRAIDLREREEINEKAFKALVRTAVSRNSATRAAPAVSSRAKPDKKDAAVQTGRGRKSR